jgi:hypothetical protein
MWSVCMGASYEHHHNHQPSRRCSAVAQVLILVPTIIAAWAVLTGNGLVCEITAAWVVLEIVVVTTALEVGYFAASLTEGLAIRPN